MRTVLAAVICMMDAVFRRPVQGNRHVEGTDCQILLHRVADRPTDHPAGIQIKDDHKINLSLPRPDLGDVAGPFRCAAPRFWLSLLAEKSRCKRFGAMLNLWSLSVVALNF